MSKKKKRKTPKLGGKPVIIKKELPPPKTIRVYKVGEASEFKKPMDMGLSYTDCLRRSYKASSPKTGSNNENEISIKAGISSSKTVSPTNSIMDISKYKMHIYISGLNTLEGISIVKDDNLAEGYFFVSDLSALSFLTSHTYNNGDKITTIKSQVNKKFVTVKSGVSFAIRLISKRIDEIQKAKLGLSDDMFLTWIEPRHLPYQEYHRKKFYEAEKDI